MGAGLGGCAPVAQIAVEIVVEIALTVLKLAGLHERYPSRIGTADAPRS
jgi:hypothetical protein